MFKNEKSRPAGGTAGAGQRGVGRDRADRVPISNSITAQSKMQRIFDIFPQGEQNAVASRDLAALVGASSVRELQSRISEEREGGALILSTCRGGGGYFKPSPGDAGKVEVERYIATLRARALNTLRVLRSAKAAVSGSELVGQVDFDELEVT